MKKMKLILNFFAILFISASAFAQSNEQKVVPAEGGKYVSCGHDHDGQPCGSYIFVPDEVTDVKASPASPTGGCTPRPYRQLIAYDDALLASGYTHQQIVDLVVKAQKRFADALDSSGIQNQAGTKIVGIIPVKIPSYTSIFEIDDMLLNATDGKLDSLVIIKNELLDADHLTVLTRQGITANEKGVNLQVTAVANNWLTKYWQKNWGIANFITFVPNLTSTFAHESGHSIGAGHESNNAGLPAYATAYVNNTKQVNDLMKGARVESWTYDRFSGPNSKIVKNGETITMCEDTSIHNAAKHISECLAQVWCATEQIVTRVSIQPTTCGSGTLHAITNNADTFTWKVVSGICTLGNTNKQDITYMASSTTTIQVIGWKQGKWYADTAYITIPAIQTFPQQMQKCIGTSVTLPNGKTYIVSKDTTMEYMLQGSKCDSFVILSIKALPTSASSQKVEVKVGQSYTLPDGKVVNVSGTYISKLINQFGCDSIITTVLTVTTATVDPQELGLRIYPNPVQEKLIIDGLLATDRIIIHDVIGRNQPVILHENILTWENFPRGVYVLTIQRGGDKAVMKVLKM